MIEEQKPITKEQIDELLKDDIEWETIGSIDEENQIKDEEDEE